ncbi:MAG: KpsF/GutQ family sugar-phosphate isomerase [Thiotrichales bacterium]|jgi:arabinose-5-phosphate isomerase|nr:KpsF/GutQ family sugar-phosphate isomerase [Thiotrichales bacterium]
MSTHIAEAKTVIQIEAAAIAHLANQLDENFSHAVNAILDTKGRLIICGMGKSGIIGKKIAATMASTGTPSFFMHPGEAYHGDLGMVKPEDVFLAISNSGETDEVIKLIPFLKDNGNCLIAMTGKPTSTLATHANFHLNIAVPQEACPLQLAPTSSTTATLVMGDALAVCLMKARAFKPEEFARFHPGGNLGKKLLSRVRHVMKKPPLPSVTPNAGVTDIVSAISHGRIGLCLVQENNKTLGVISDGDLRRAMIAKAEDFMHTTAQNLMTTNPKSIGPDARLGEAEAMMAQYKITALLVQEQEKIIGVIEIYDIK